MNKLKIVVGFLFVLYGCEILAQSKYSYSQGGGILITNRIITQAESDFYKEYRNANEKYSVGFNLEATIYYKIMGKLYLETGIGFLKNGYETNEVRLIDPGFSPITAGYESELYSYPFHSIYIPLHLTYNTLNKLNFLMSVGPTILFTVYNTCEWILREEYGKSEFQKKQVTTNVDDIGALNISFDLVMGIGYRITDKFNLVLTPSVMYNITGYENSDIKQRIYEHDGDFPQNENMATKEHLINFGLNLKIISGI
jgi:hypothetical protein